VIVVLMILSNMVVDQNMFNCKRASSLMRD
jgi:hypothetical protein